MRLYPHTQRIFVQSVTLWRSGDSDGMGPRSSNAGICAVVVLKPEVNVTTKNGVTTIGLQAN